MPNVFSPSCVLAYAYARVAVRDKEKGRISQLRCSAEEGMVEV